MTDLEIFDLCHEKEKTVVTTDGKSYSGMMWVTTGLQAQEDEGLDEGYIEVGPGLQILFSEIAEIK